MCRRKAEKDKIPSLEFKFWNKTQKQNYQSQIVAARRLIKEFGEHAVLSYINNNKNIYSLGRFNSPKFIKDGIKKYKNNKPKSLKLDDYNTSELSSRKSKITNLMSKIKKVENG